VEGIVGERQGFSIHRLHIQQSVESMGPSHCSLQHGPAEIHAVDHAGRIIVRQVDAGTKADLKHLAPRLALKSGEKSSPKTPQEQGFSDPLPLIVETRPPFVHSANVFYIHCLALETTGPEHGRREGPKWPRAKPLDLPALPETSQKSGHRR
jgi:hypothetical protein